MRAGTRQPRGGRPALTVSSSCGEVEGRGARGVGRGSHTALGKLRCAIGEKCGE